MGWCHEFGPQIHEGCDHPMVAEASACTCAECGTICHGRFNGCPAVWASGPALNKVSRGLEPIVLAEASSDGRRPDDVLAADFSMGAAPEVVPARPAPLPEAPPPAAWAPSSVLRPSPRPSPKPPRAPRAPHEGGLAGLRERLDGLRGDLKLLGDTLDRRAGESLSPSGDRG